MFKRLGRVLVVLCFAVAAYGQGDPSTWPTVIDGVTSMGPYQWMDGPTAIAGGKLPYAVLGGVENNVSLYVCRATLSDGVHPGKAFSGECNIGWGGTEVVKTSGYELLINTRPDLASYLGVNWVTPPEAGFVGGKAGTTNMRVCHGSYNNAWHPGKEWSGKCNIGWGGKEIAASTYQVLQLTFNKTNWQLTGASTITIQPTDTSGGTIICTGCTGTLPTTTTISMTTTSEPVIVATQAHNGVFVKTTDNSCLGAQTNSFYPKDAAASVTAGMRYGAIKVYADGVMTSCLDDPRTWLIREDVYKSSTTGYQWFRLHYFQGNLCLQPVSGNESLVAFAACNTSKDQWWGITPKGDALVSGLSITSGSITVDTDMTLMSVIFGQPVKVTPEANAPTLSMLALWTTNFGSSSWWDNTVAAVSKNSFYPLVIEQDPTWSYSANQRKRYIP